MSRRTREKRSKHGSSQKRTQDDLFVFGYASKLFRDDKIAGFHEEGRHLIPWQGDDSLLIDRYDCRLLFTEKSQFEFKPGALSYSLSPEEDRIERLCDEERYLELSTNLEEHDIEQEEEMKRFKEAISEDGAYSAIGFSYENNGQESPVENKPTMESTWNQPQVTEPAPLPVIEKFIAPEELEVPDGMEIPDTSKMNAIIEKTAMFVSGQGTQMEILVKAKQAGNPQFDFLNFDNWLNPYYKHMLKYIRDGRYIPLVQNQPSPKQQEENKPESESDEDDSDGEFELHPLLTASHRSASGTPNSSAPSSPAPNIGDQYNFPSSTASTLAIPVSYPIDVSSSGDILGSYPVYPTSDGTDIQHEVTYQTEWTQHNQVSYNYDNAISTVAVPPAPTPLMSVADMLPPPPPPPGEGPLEGDWPGTDVSIPHHIQPQSQYPIQDNRVMPSVLHDTHQIPGHPVMMPAVVPTPIVPPSPDVQPIIDKLALYVAKNGNDFENIIKAKNDQRFAFVHPWNENHQYYLYKKQLCFEQIERERKEASVKDTKATASPISFSIKPKEVTKPKIEYRTNVIYKQSYEPGESEDEENKEEENSDGSSNGNESGKVESSDNEPKIESETQKENELGVDLEIQINSIEAAEKEARRLEAESQSQREKQLQIERKRKASLFISMLKKTTGAEEQSQNSEAERGLQSNGDKRRKFTETKRTSDTRLDMFEDKRVGYEAATTSGVGAPSPDIIKVTQDLMAKVRAASRNNR